MSHPSPTGPGYGYDAVRRALVVGDPRLTKLLQREPERCASLSEYAAATGIETGRVMELFAPALDAGALGFEPVGPEIFIHTAPSGRPAPAHCPDVAANLWERLRGHGDKHHAYQLWQLMRSLQDAGWRVEANRGAIMFALHPMGEVPALGLTIGSRVVPLVVYPPVSVVASPNGRLYELVAAGAGSAAIVCDSGALDEMVTAVRRFYMDVSMDVSMNVLILEGPRFAPVLLTQHDASVAPRSVTRASLEQACDRPRPVGF
jgi:hypothetical protein